MTTSPMNLSGQTIHQGRFEIRFPKNLSEMDQDQEQFEVNIGDEWKRFRLHDYDAVYDVPGLYEALIYETLQCRSPQAVTGLLSDVINDSPMPPQDLRILELGAGNGIVAQRFREMGVRHVVGLDLLPEAEASARRDRPGVYNDYLVADLTKLTPEEEKRLDDHKFNSLVTVAALGFGDIPPDAFAKACSFIEKDGWIAATIKQDFLSEDDQSGFSRLMRKMISGGVIKVEAHRRYLHRYSMSGEELFYVVLVARKAKEIPEEMVREASEPPKKKSKTETKPDEAGYASTLMST